MSPIMNNWGARLEPKSGGAGEESGWGPVQGKKRCIVVVFLCYLF